MHIHGVQMHNRSTTNLQNLQDLSCKQVQCSLACDAHINTEANDAAISDPPSPQKSQGQDQKYGIKQTSKRNCNPAASLKVLLSDLAYGLLSNDRATLCGSMYTYDYYLDFSRLKISMP